MYLKMGRFSEKKCVIFSFALSEIAVNGTHTHTPQELFTKPFSRQSAIKKMTSI